MGKELACNAEDVGNVGSNLRSFFLCSHMFAYILQFSIRNMEYFLKIIIWWVFFFPACLVFSIHTEILFFKKRKH